jgi:hypothetical protein
MKKKLIVFSIILLGTMVIPSCKKEIGNLNSPTVEVFLGNASKSELNNLVTGSESGMRNNIAMYLDVVGMIGREMYRFSGAEPRYTTELLGFGDATLDNNTFYLTNPWGSRYRVVKNCNLLIQAANNSTLLTDAERKGYLGFARTFKAYQLLINLNMTYNNGIRVDVIDPANPGPVLNNSDALAAISGLLDSAKTDLTGADIAYPLTSGFGDFRDAAGLIKVNRAMAARVYAYRSLWPDVLTALNESFFSLIGNLNTGVNLVFSTASGDQLNQAFFPQNQAGEVRLAHPSYIPDLTAGDDRTAKATLRTSPASTNDLTSDRDVWVYTTSTAPMPVIRNEELILLYAEAQTQLGSIPDATTAINRIRSSHNLNPYAGAVTPEALVNEILYQRRFSLFFEGHRWVDMRRYNKLNELPIDRPGDDVWVEFPLPLTDDF